MGMMLIGNLARRQCSAISQGGQEKSAKTFSSDDPTPNMLGNGDKDDQVARKSQAVWSAVSEPILIDFLQTSYNRLLRLFRWNEPRNAKSLEQEAEAMNRWPVQFLWGAATFVLMANWVTAQQPSRRPVSNKQTPIRPVVTPKKQSTDRKTHDLTKLHPVEREMYRSALAGSQWLLRFNRPSGQFLYGYVPSLRRPLEGDNYIHQVQAAFALARAAGFYGEKKQMAVARQAILTLLLETKKPHKTSALRYTIFANQSVNRLAAAAWLVLAINELPEPGADLLVQSEELCNFIRSQQLTDGSMCCTGSPRNAAGNANIPGNRVYAGQALYALGRSLRHRSGEAASWKLDTIKKAFAYYRKSWQAKKTMEMVPWHSAAYGEACLRTKEQVYADWVYEMNDWICKLQYKQATAENLQWFGGFQGWSGKHPVFVDPTIHSAVYMEGLAQGARVARMTGDIQRHNQYRTAMFRCGQFLSLLQYKSANTTHFQPRFRELILGGYHASHQDGILRLDYTQEAVSGLVVYLRDVAKVPH
ncbi:MAG: hypothetical protein ACFCD0_09310 [Gemmataceae bacterium]